MYLPRWARAKLRRHVGELSTELRIRYYQARGLPMPLDLRGLELFAQFGRAAAQYDPQPYDGHVLLFRAQETAVVFEHAGDDLGWGNLLPNLDVRFVPGNHDTLVLEPNVQIVANGLREILG